MNATTDATSIWKELAHRENDGVEVTLAWDETTDDLAVSVTDARTGTAFSLAVARDKALDAFYHPFFYAASPTAPSTSLLVSI